MGPALLLRRHRSVGGRLDQRPWPHGPRAGAAKPLGLEPRRGFGLSCQSHRFGALPFVPYDVSIHVG